MKMSKELLVRYFVESEHTAPAFNGLDVLSFVRAGGWPDAGYRELEPFLMEQADAGKIEKTGMLEVPEFKRSIPTWRKI